MRYQHRYVDGNAVPLPPGKVVCVGRNYLEHIKELRNPVSETPILFMKPSTALIGLDRPLVLPVDQGSCHHEVELAVLVGQELCRINAETARRAVNGYAVALDLTLRDLQGELKEKSYPWEMAKAFDGGCPISPFISPAAFPDPQNVELLLEVNDEVRQQGNTRQMIWPIFELMAYISSYFTLLPGDIVLTGTPSGVGELRSGDRLRLALGETYRFEARIA